MTRKCNDPDGKGCRNDVEQAAAGGGQRKACTTCRPTRVRRKAAGEGSGQGRQSAPAPAVGAPAPAGPAGPRVVGDLETATAARLVEAGRRDTLAGELLLQLARRMDAAESPSAYATLAGQYRAAIGDALPEATTPAGPVDPADDIARRRAEKRRAAGA